MFSFYQLYSYKVNNLADYNIFICTKSQPTCYILGNKWMLRQCCGSFGIFANYFNVILNFTLTLAQNQKQWILFANIAITLPRYCFWYRMLIHIILIWCAAFYVLSYRTINLIINLKILLFSPGGTWTLRQYFPKIKINIRNDLSAYPLWHSYN